MSNRRPLQVLNNDDERHCLVMRDYRRALVMERKPTATGGNKSPVGGEVYPANLLALVSANIMWVLLLVVPVVLSYVLARRGLRMPSAIRQVLRLVPVLMHAVS